MSALSLEFAPAAPRSGSCTPFWLEHVEPLTDRELARVFLKMPAITLKVIAAIHWEALKLWAKGIGFRPRPAAA